MKRLFTIIVSLVCSLGFSQIELSNGFSPSLEPRFDNRSYIWNVGYTYIPKNVGVKFNYRNITVRNNYNHDTYGVSLVLRTNDSDKNYRTSFSGGVLYDERLSKVRAVMGIKQALRLNSNDWFIMQLENIEGDRSTVILSFGFEIDLKKHKNGL